MRDVSVAVFQGYVRKVEGRRSKVDVTSHERCDVMLYQRPGPAYFFFGRTFDLVFSQTVALRMRDYALSRDSAYCLPMIYTFQLE